MERELHIKGWHRSREIRLLESEIEMERDKFVTSREIS